MGFSHRQKQAAGGGGVATATVGFVYIVADLPTVIEIAVIGAAAIADAKVDLPYPFAALTDEEAIGGHPFLGGVRGVLRRADKVNFAI